VPCATARIAPLTCWLIFGPDIFWDNGPGSFYLGPEFIHYDGGFGFAASRNDLLVMTSKKSKPSWWQEDLSTYRKAAIEPPGDTDVNPDVEMPAAGDAGRRSYLLSRILAEGGVPRGRSDGLAAGLIAACEGAVAMARAENSITPFHLVVAEQLKAIKEAMV
jgi:hypothetical protein